MSAFSALAYIYMILRLVCFDTNYKYAIFSIYRRRIIRCNVEQCSGSIFIILIIFAAHSGFCAMPPCFSLGCSLFRLIRFRLFRRFSEFQVFDSYDIRLDAVIAAGLRGVSLKIARLHSAFISSFLFISLASFFLGIWRLLLFRFRDGIEYAFRLLIISPPFI